MNNTWNHALARRLVPLSVGTWVRPNHISSLRLSGLASCVLLAIGGQRQEAGSAGAFANSGNRHDSRSVSYHD
jgi:hypothetical protein